MNFSVCLDGRQVGRLQLARLDGVEGGDAVLEAAKAEIVVLKETIEKKEKKEMLCLQRTAAMARRIEVLGGEADKSVGDLARCREELVVARGEAERLRREIAHGVAREEQVEARHREELEDARGDIERLRQELAHGAAREEVAGELLRVQRRNPIGLFSCTLCLERYRLVVKRPYVLACGHTFCQQCLEMMCHVARGTDARLRRLRRPVPRRRMSCPTCRRSTRTPNFNLEEFAHVNFVLENPADEEEEEEMDVPAVVPMAVDQAPVVEEEEEEEMDDEHVAQLQALVASMKKRIEELERENEIERERGRRLAEEAQRYFIRLDRLEELVSDLEKDGQ